MSMYRPGLFGRDAALRARQRMERRLERRLDAQPPEHIRSEHGRAQRMIIIIIMFSITRNLWNPWNH